MQWNNDRSTVNDGNNFCLTIRYRRLNSWLLTVPFFLLQNSANLISVHHFNPKKNGLRFYKYGLYRLRVAWYKQKISLGKRKRLYLIYIYVCKTRFLRIDLLINRSVKSTWKFFKHLYVRYSIWRGRCLKCDTLPAIAKLWRVSRRGSRREATMIKNFQGSTSGWGGRNWR